MYTNNYMTGQTKVHMNDRKVFKEPEHYLIKLITRRAL